MESAKDGKQPKCKQCVKEYQKANPEGHRKRQQDYRQRGGSGLRRRERSRHLRENFGIDADDFDDMLAAQGGRCAACGTDEVPKGNWHIDHDHSCCPGIKTCGKCIRGILCSRCNKSLGMLEDNPAIIYSLALYAAKHRGRITLPPSAG